MTDAQTPQTSSPDDKPAPQAKLLKGCGCLGGLLVMALGILVIGNFDTAAWASALSALVIGVLVFSLSGVNGVWDK